MAITLTYNSVQVTEQNAVAHTPSDTQEYGGRVRVAYGTYETPASTGVADGSSIAMVRLPAGARIVRGVLHNDAMGSGKLDVGVAGADGSGYYDAAGTLADDDDFFAVNLDTTSATVETTFLTLIASASYQFDKEVYIVATAETAALDAEKTLTFVVFYVVD